MWDCCCDGYAEQSREDDCCPDWCESRRVRGRFGLAFVAETPCCCPEPIGWQVEFCDTPSKVEQRCKEMVQWANCPPLPRCEPCPPVEVVSPCFPPRCNPCCPLTNPCPPSCPPRCRPPCCPPPRKKNCSCCPPPRIECYCPPPKDPCCCCPPPCLPKKCCCAKPKPKSKCCKCDADDDDEDDCPCNKGSDGKGKKRPKERPSKSKGSDDDRGDVAERDRMSQKSSYMGDEVPVKESKDAKPATTPSNRTTESKTYNVNIPPPYRNSNQRASTPARTGRDTTVEHRMNNQNLSTSPQGGSYANMESSAMRTDNDYDANLPEPHDNDQTEHVQNFINYHPPSNVDSHHSNVSKNRSSRNNLTREEQQGSPRWNKRDLPDEDDPRNAPHNHPTNYGEDNDCLDCPMGDNRQENIVAYAQYRQSMNFHPRQYPQIEEIPSNNSNNFYGTPINRQDKQHYSANNFDVAESFVSSGHTMPKKTRGSNDSRIIPGRRTSSSPDRLSGSIKISSTTHPRQSQLGKFTTVYSNMETHDTEEVLIVKRRKWLPYEFLKNVKKKFFDFFKSSSDDTDSNCSDNVASSDQCKKVVSAK